MCMALALTSFKRLLQVERNLFADVAITSSLIPDEYVDNNYHHSNTRAILSGAVGSDNVVQMADWLWNSSSGSFWLPRPPPRDVLIGGYEVRPRNDTDDTSSSSQSSPSRPKEYEKSIYKGLDGFVQDDRVNIMMSETYNAGDFLSYFIAPMISGRLVDKIRDIQVYLF